MTQKAIPVLVEFGWERQEAIAQYDAASHTLTMQIRPGGAVDGLLAGTVPDNEIRALSFAWSRTRQVHRPDPRAEFLLARIDDELAAVSEDPEDGESRLRAGMLRAARAQVTMYEEIATNPQRLHDASLHAIFHTMMAATIRPLLMVWSSDPDFHDGLLS